jgi:hypothetical protein
MKLEGHLFEEGELHESLISISQICNNFDITCILNKNGIKFCKDGKTLLEEFKKPDDKLWYITLEKIKSLTNEQVEKPQSNVATKFDNSKQEIQHFFRIFGNQPISTMIKAIQAGFLDHFPNVPTPDKISKNKPNPVPIAKGHMKLISKNINSTKIGAKTYRESISLKNLDTEENKLEEGINSILQMDDLKANHAFNFVLSADEMINHSDATGKFPITSVEGYNYILVSIFRGYISCQGMESRTQLSYEKAYKHLYSHYKRHGHIPTFQRIDNEKSHLILQFFKDSDTKIQFVPPHNHRGNKAENAIRWVKNGLISMLLGASSTMPAKLWSKALPQLEIILNHLRPWHGDTTKSAFEGFHGKKYDFSNHPIAPWGIDAVVNEKVRTTWGPQATEVKYIGPAPDHWRAVTVFDPVSEKDRITDTIEYKPEDYVDPDASLITQLQHSFIDVVEALRTTTKLLNEIRISNNINPDQKDKIDSDVKEFESSTFKIAKHFHQDVIEIPIGRKMAPEETTYSDQNPNPIIDTEIAKDGTNELNIIKEINEIIDVPSQEVPLKITPTVPIQEVTLKITPVAPIQGVKPKITPTKVPSLMQTRNLATRRGIVAATTTTIKSKEEIEVDTKTYEKHASIKNNPVLGLDENGKKLKYKTAIQGANKNIWHHKNYDEYCRLFDNKTWKAIHPHEQPADRIKDTMYISKQLSEKYDNSEEYAEEGYIKRRVRMTTGGDKANYDGYTKADTADLTVVKMLINATISDSKSKFATADIENFYLNQENVLDRPEYIKLKIKDIPTEIMKKYKLQEYIHNESILMQILTGMYGLAQAGRIAQETLITKLQEAGYLMDNNVKCLFIHETRSTMFTLTVDDFGIKYNNDEDLQHLIEALEKVYKVKVNLKGDKYLGMNIEWDYEKRTAEISIKGYIEKLLTQFPQYTKQYQTPSIYTAPKYGAKLQQQVTYDQSNLVSEHDIKIVQKIVGSLGYYGRVADPTFITTVNEIATESTKATENTMKKVERLMGYARAFPNNFTKFYKSDMILKIQADASHNSRPNGRSVLGGIHYLTTIENLEDNLYVNGPINCISSLSDVVIASATEAEYASVSKNARAGVYERQVLEAMGYKQPPTIILTDNEVAIGLSYDRLKQKCSKSIDLRFHWIRDRVKQGQFTIPQFKVNFIKGINNLADFFTKSLPEIKFKEMMHQIVQIPFISPDHFQNKKANRANKYKYNKLVNEEVC